ncbi:hypothetical protein Tco_0905090 [Tanacetum coccineum]
MIFPSSEQPPRKRCVYPSSSRYEIRRGVLLLDPTRGQGIDMGCQHRMLKREDRDSGLGCSGWRQYGLWRRRPMLPERLGSSIKDWSQADHPGFKPTVIHVVYIRDPYSRTLDTATDAEYSHSDTSPETLRVMRDMRQEMSDMQAELLAHQEQQRRARQPGPEARIQTTRMLLGMLIWNGQIRSLGPDAYSMTWEVLKKKITASIVHRFVANETEKVDKYINGLPDNIYGNVKSVRPKTLDETIELASLDG